MAVLLASSLKPCTDVRMYQKIACSLATHYPQEEYFLVGFKSEIPNNSPKNIHFLPIFFFKRLSFKRILANFLLIKILFRQEPQKIIVCTFELLPACFVYACFKKVFLIYDLQENYFANILHTPHFSRWLKYPLAYAVRWIEKISSYKINAYFLAEQCYISELHCLHKGKYLLLENKVIDNQVVENKIFNPQTGLSLALVGTISKSYGVFEAIDFGEKLYQMNPKTTLLITGACLIEKEYQQIQAIAQEKKFITLQIFTQPIDYQVIIQTISKADFVLLPYQLQKNILQRIPTKMYECLYFRKKMIIQQNKFWQDYLAQYAFKSAIFVNFQAPDNLPHIWAAMQNTSFYANSEVNSAQFTWKTEKKKLIDFFT